MRTLLAGLLLLGVGPTGLLGAAPPALAASPAAEPSLRIARVETPPEIDARLDDPVWEQAAVIDGLTQVTPIEGVPETEHTEIRLCYDADALYIYVRAWDRDPSAIVATVMVQDLDMTSDDRINIVIDTFNNRRDAFFFQINPVGTRGDALIEGDTNFIRDWDGIFYGKAAIDDEGWRAELAIPFKTVNFDPESDTWGFNIARRIRRYNEEDRWSAVTQDVSIVNVSRIGTLTGLRDLEQGMGLDVKPSLALTYERDREKSDTDRIGRAGGDIFYKFTPSLTGVLTVNTDFSEAPVDERQVNLTRFALLFPETRDFFLQDSTIFLFGGLKEENGIPFFSRRIGIVDDEVVNMRGGVKLTGRHGPLNLGFLDVVTEPFDDVDAANLFVGRVAFNVLAESSLGAIVTHGDPASNDDNALVGVDFRYRSSRFRTDKTLVGDFWWQHSFSERVEDREHVDGRETAFGAKVEYPNDLVNWRLEFTELQENFNPALGFVNRRGIRQYESFFRYRIRPDRWLRAIDSEMTGLAVTNRDNNLETGRFTWQVIELESNAADLLGFSWIYNTERLDQPFRLPDGVVIPVGDYTWHRFSIKADTSNGRPVRGILELIFGDYFDGHRTDTIATLELRPSPHFFLGVDYTQNDIRLPQGNVTTRLVKLRMNVSFSPDLFWETLTQYDNVSDRISIRSRVSWIMEPGNELYLVYDQGYFVDDGRPHPTFSRSTAKIVYTFRF